TDRNSRHRFRLYGFSDLGPCRGVPKPDRRASAGNEYSAIMTEIERSDIIITFTGYEFALQLPGPDVPDRDRSSQLNCGRQGSAIRTEGNATHLAVVLDFQQLAPVAGIPQAGILAVCGGERPLYGIERDRTDLIAVPLQDGTLRCGDR